MDVRLNSEQQQLRSAAKRLGAELGPKSVADLQDLERVARLRKIVDGTGWWALRREGASGVEVALVAEEFGRGLIDVPFLGPVLADDARRCVAEPDESTIVVDQHAPDGRDFELGLRVDDQAVLTVALGERTGSTDLTRCRAAITGSLEEVGRLTVDQSLKCRALSLVVTAADMLGAARGALELATDYAKIRSQYGKTIGSYQAIAHLLAEGLTLTEASQSTVSYAAWAIDELPAAEAIDAAELAKVYTERAARTVCETSIQVHGGIGNTWDCLAHVYLRRVLVAASLWPVALREVNIGLS